MNKQEQIEAYLSEPIKVGDPVTVRGLGIQNKGMWGNTTRVKEIGENDSIFIEEHARLKEVKSEDWKKYTGHIGYNPFPKKPWNSGLRVISFSLDSIMHQIGVDRRNRILTTEEVENVEIQGLNYNPFIIDKNGNKIFFQRNFCWELKDKQLLISSIYNQIDIGKIVVRKRSYTWVREQIKEGNSEASFLEVIDGKQRLKCISDFILGYFPDENGMYFSELSDHAKHNFFNFQGLSYGELGEDCSDEDVKAIFLNVNFTGVQMSQEHIEFVKSINL